MNLDFVKNIENSLKSADTKNFINKFIDELSNFLEKNNTSKYSQYWKYQNFIEDNVSANIGLSRYASDITYKDELSTAVDESILELSERKGALYRKQFRQTGDSYNIYKYENGEIENMKLYDTQIPIEYRDKDIIFELRKDGSIKVREDLKEKVINLASKKCEELKIKEKERAKSFKKEGHVYKALEDDGYIFLRDSTEEGYLLEDIDFVVDCYEGEGKYQVINGEYMKIEE